jgi:hypothetical protein
MQALMQTMKLMARNHCCGIFQLSVLKSASHKAAFGHALMATHSHALMAELISSCLGRLFSQALKTAHISS